MRLVDWKSTSDGKIWRCSDNKCRKTLSLRHGSFFENSRLSLEKILIFSYCFATNTSLKTALHESSTDEHTTSPETGVDWYQICREVCLNVEIHKYSKEKIGGEGMHVEIDESKFGRIKKNKQGEILEDGVWVLGGICRETRDIFLVPVYDRTRKTLITEIKKHVAPKSTVITDCWKAYDRLLDDETLNLRAHLTVNHSLYFKDPETGAHTNTVESLWWQVKRQLPPTRTNSNPDHFTLRLAEYIWRTIHRKEDMFLEFLNDVTYLYDPYSHKDPDIPLKTHIRRKQREEKQKEYELEISHNELLDDVPDIGAMVEVGRDNSEDAQSRPKRTIQKPLRYREDDTFLISKTSKSTPMEYSSPDESPHSHRPTRTRRKPIRYREEGDFSTSPPIATNTKSQLPDISQIIRQDHDYF